MSKTVNAKDIIRVFFDSLYDEEIPIALIDLPDVDDEISFSSNYNLISSSSFCNLILSCYYDVATKYNINFSINRVENGKVKIYMFGLAEQKPVLINIHTCLEVKGSESIGYIFYENVQPFILFDSNTRTAIDPEIEALIFLSYLYTKGKSLNNTKVILSIEYYKKKLEQNESEVSDIYRDLAGSNKSIHHVAKKAHSILIDRGVLLTTEHRSILYQEKMDYLSLYKINIYAKLLRLIKIFPVVGPDGVGKTAIIEELKRESVSLFKYYRFKNMFRHNILYQLSYPFLKNSVPSNSNKDQYADLFGQKMIFFARCKFPFLALYSLLNKSIYLSDRFFHDFVIENTRFVEKQTKLRSNWKRLISKIPGSYWFVHLDAPTDVVLSRKQEITAQAIDAYRRDIFLMYLQKPSFVYSYVNTSNTIEDCVDSLIFSSKEFIEH